MAAEQIFSIIGLTVLYSIFLLTANALLVDAPYITMVVTGVVIFVTNLTVVQAIIVIAASYWPLVTLAIDEFVTEDVRLHASADGQQDD